jgi:hypothetical protein
MEKKHVEHDCRNDGDSYPLPYLGRDGPPGVIVEAN